jgi:predicted HicB family RNase H-like nuclease
MNSGINYRGYTGSIEFSEEDAVFHGKVVGIKSTISFEGDCAQTLTEDFHNAIDEYIEHCEKVWIEPEIPFKGSLMLSTHNDSYSNEICNSLPSPFATLFKNCSEGL